METARFTDWNSFLGTLLISLIAMGVFVGACLNPATFFDDPRLAAKLIPFAGPIVAVGALYRVVVYVEFGPQIVFRKILGRRACDWNQLKGFGPRETSQRYLFGLVKFSHQLLVFAVEDDGRIREYAYRISSEKRPILERIVGSHMKEQCGPAATARSRQAAQFG